MSGLFLSYRRDDTADDAYRIHRRLADRFGDELVYIDVEDIPLGVDFMAHIRHALERAAYVLVAIGPRWLLVTDEQGQRRLQDPEDPVRFEIRTALEHERLVVPMLIGGATMPDKSDLPGEIAPLVLRNGIAIRPDPDFEADVDALMDGLHVDRLDESRVPIEFRVGLVARNLGFGGAVGWAILGAVAGILSMEDSGVAALALVTAASALVGWLGGSLVGWITGLLIRHKAPPLVAREVRRMGVTWSLGLTISVAVATGIGILLGMNAFEGLVEQAGGFGETFGAIVGGIVVLAVIVAGVTLLGLFVGSSIAAAYFARRLRLRSEEISRRRAIAIAVVWLLGGLLTGIGFLAVLGLPEAVLGG